MWSPFTTSFLFRFTKKPCSYAILRRKNFVVYYFLDNYCKVDLVNYIVNSRYIVVLMILKKGLFMMHEDYPISSRIQSFMYSMFGWMAAALLVSAFTAYYVAVTPAVFNWIYSNMLVLIMIFIAQIGLVIGLSLWLPRLTLLTALVMFFVYAGLLGVTLSIIFHLYTAVSIFSTFITAAGMFGAMAIYGYLTRADLTTVGNISVMILLGLIIALVVNLFLKSATIDLIISGVGVVIFALLTAYDVQKLKQLAQRMLAEQETMQKVAVLGALMLYLDFINLFLFLLRFMGRQQKE